MDVKDMDSSVDQSASLSGDKNSMLQDCAATEMATAACVSGERGRRKTKSKVKRVVRSLHVDIIGSKFWTEHPDILQGE